MLAWFLPLTQEEYFIRISICNCINKYFLHFRIKSVTTLRGLKNRFKQKLTLKVRIKLKIYKKNKGTKTKEQTAYKDNRYFRQKLLRSFKPKAKYWISATSIEISMIQCIKSNCQYDQN